jgi:signal transduction histidine kinase
VKTREIFQQIRNQKGGDSLRLRLTLLVSAEIVVSILLALGLYYLLADMIPMDDTWLLLLDLIVISLVVGSVVTLVMSRYFFDPIKKLGKAMEQVADGDFSVRLDEKSSSKEIMEVYTGFNMMAHELSATEILHTDFVSNVSHEFKTPINAIEGYCMLLQGSENMSAEQQAYIHKIVFNTHRLSSLVGSILLLSKLENQQIPTGQTRFRLDEQIRQSIVALEPAWEKKDLEFDVELPRVEYTGNEAMLRHVWDNLIGNAVKFSPEGGMISMALSEEEGKWVIAISDQGPGISEDAQKHIFDQFFQADSSHKEEGNGLGLALVKRILTIENGSIRVENRLQGGAKFVVSLQQK